jgi:hypothetical protein
MASPKLFTTWREAWCKHADIAELLREAETLIARRSNGSHKYPILPDAAFAHAENAAEAMGLWLDGKLPPPEVGPVGEVARSLYNYTWPMLQAAAWPRWLLLEQAFQDASDTGDLQFAALTLRTMCEEIERQRPLDIDQSRFVSLAVSNLADDQERFVAILKCVRASIVPLAKDALDLPNSDGRTDKLAPDTDLDCARASLNDYVHPNYGSQVVALYPERTTAARILLTAVVVVYRAFFALSWSEQPLGGGSRPVPVQHLSWSRATRDVVSRILPAARDLVRELEIPSALDWLTQPHDAAMSVLESPEATKLLDTLPEAAKIADLTIAGNGPWTGAAPNALLNLALARRSESLLTREFPNGAPPVQETDRWFSFLARAIELVLLVNEVKEASFKSQLVRQLAQRNALAIELCVRSLIEHRAAVAILPERLARKWIETARRIQPGASVPLSIQDMDNAITKLLAGRRNSAEPLLPFATREDGKPITVSISLPALVDDAFGEFSPISKYYDVASAAIHGRIQRGKELLRDRSRSEATRSCLTGLIILDWICHSGEQKEYWFPAMQIMMNAKHAARQNGKVDPQDRRKVRQVMGAYEGNLKPGKDYTGDGTKASPILFRDHLLYYSAIRQLLQQINIDPAGPQVLDRDDHGRLCDRYSGQARDWWFAIPGSCFHLLLDGMEGEGFENT